MKSKDFDIKIEINKDISKQTEKFLTLDMDKKSVRASSDESIDKNSAESKAKADELSESIKKQKKELKELRKEIKETNASMKEAKKEYKEQEENVNGLTEKLKKAREEHGKNSKQVKELKKELRAATKEFNQTKNSISQSENTLTSLNGKVAESKTELKGLKESFKEVSSTLGEKLTSSLSVTGEKITGVGEKFNSVSGVLSDFGGIGNLEKEKLEEFEGALKTLGTSTKEIFTAMPESVQEGIKSFKELQKTVGALGTIGAVIGGEIVKIGGLISSLAGLGAPIIVALAIAIIMCMAVVENFDNISAAMVRLQEGIADSGIGESFSLIWTMLQEIWATIGEPLIAAMGELIVIAIDFITQAMPGISNTFTIVCELLMAAWKAIGKPVFDFIMLVVDEVVAWLGEYMPVIAEVFNSVMESLRNLWDTVGKPVFEILKAVIEGAIEAVKPILESLKNTFGSMVDAIKSVWEGILKPVFDGLVSICGGLISKAMPYIDQFKSGVKTAMDFVLSPIKFVSDAFGKLLDIISGVGRGIGSFLNKINPFKSIEGAVVVDYGYDYGMAPIMEGYSQIALSGQYYNSKSSLDSGLNQIIRTANGFMSEPNYASNFFNGELLADTIAAAIQNALAANLNIAVNTSIDGRQVAKATAKYMDSEINTLNKRKLRYGGSF